MTISNLVFAELRHRLASFLLGSLAVAVVSASVIFGMGLLRIHDAETEAQVAELEATTEAEMKALEDSIRKSMKGLGFNIYIFNVLGISIFSLKVFRDNIKYKYILFVRKLYFTFS